MLIEDVLGPPLELLGYLVIPICYFMGILGSTFAIAFLCLSFVFATGISIGTLALEERQLRRTPNAADLGRIALAAIIENFGYRQANLVYRLHGYWKFMRKERTWAAVPRLGFTTDQAAPGTLPPAADLHAAQDEPTPYEHHLAANAPADAEWRARGAAA